MQHLSETVSSIQEYGDKLENLKSASTTFLNVLKNQDSVSYATLSEEWECGIIGYIDEIQGRLDLLESALSNYIEDMKGYISPESKDAMMRVDRNDIWYNIQQIAQQYEQFLTIQGDAGSSYPDYRHFAIGLSAEEELLMREQEERERERRERNYQKLVSFRQGSVNNALNYFLENIGDINAIYKNAIIPFENTDDDYASLAEFYYDMWATTGDNWTDFLRSSGDICRGLGDATVDMLDGIASLGAFAIYESVPARCSANGDIALLPDCITERALGTCAAMCMSIGAVVRDTGMAGGVKSASLNADWNSNGKTAVNGEGFVLDTGVEELVGGDG